MKKLSISLAAAAVAAVFVFAGTAEARKNGRRTRVIATKVKMVIVKAKTPRGFIRTKVRRVIKKAKVSRRVIASNYRASYGPKKSFGTHKNMFKPKPVVLSWTKKAFMRWLRKSKLSRNQKQKLYRLWLRRHG